MSITNLKLNAFREKLLDMEMPRLQEEGKKYGIQLTTEDKTRWIDAIIDAVIRHNLPLQIDNGPFKKPTGEHENEDSPASGNASFIENSEVHLLDTPNFKRDLTSPQDFPLEFKKMMEQQALILQMLKSMSINRNVDEKLTSDVLASQQPVKHLHKVVGRAQSQWPDFPMAQQPCNPSHKDGDIAQNQWLGLPAYQQSFKPVDDRSQVYPSISTATQHMYKPSIESGMAQSQFTTFQDP